MAHISSKQWRTRALLATDGASESSLIRERCERPICARVQTLQSVGRQEVLALIEKEHQET